MSDRQTQHQVTGAKEAFFITFLCKGTGPCPRSHREISPGDTGQNRATCLLQGQSLKRGQEDPRGPHESGLPPSFMVGASEPTGLLQLLRSSWATSHATLLASCSVCFPGWKTPLRSPSHSIPAVWPFLQPGYVLLKVNP